MLKSGAKQTHLTIYNPRLLFTLQGQQSHRVVIFVAIFILMTLILYGSNNASDAIYTPFHVDTSHTLRITDLKKWAGKEGYVPVYGNKVLVCCHVCRAQQAARLH